MRLEDMQPGMLCISPDNAMDPIRVLRVYPDEWVFACEFLDDLGNVYNYKGQMADYFEPQLVLRMSSDQS